MVADTLRLDSNGRGSTVLVLDVTMPGGMTFRDRRESPVLVRERSGQLYLAIDYSCDHISCLPEPRHLLTPVGERLFLRYWADLREYTPVPLAP
jgi:hypothetical protein